MTYNIEFYLFTDGESAGEVSRRIISSISSGAGAYLTGEKSGPSWWSSFIGSSLISAESGALVLEARTSPELVKELIDDAIAEGAPSRVASTDAFVSVTLVGDDVDWAMVRSIWGAVESTWPMIARDDGSGFGASINSLP